MTLLEQRLSLSHNSLKIIERMLLSEMSRLKKKAKKPNRHFDSHYRLLRDYEKAYSEVIEALGIYRNRVE